MFRLLELRRLDVWPVDDLGVRNGYRIIYGLAEMPKPKELQALGEVFRPYRSIAAWYCWQAVPLSRVAMLGPGAEPPPARIAATPSRGASRRPRTPAPQG